MAHPNQEAIDTFISITGVTESIALQKLQEHNGDLNAAVNAHFSEGDRSTTRDAPAVAPQDDLMDIDDDPSEVLPRRNPISLLSESNMTNPFSLLDEHFRSSLFGGASDFINQAPFVSHPRERREIPIEVKDGSDASNPSGHAPVIEDVTGTVDAHGADVHGNVTVIEDDDIPANLTSGPASQIEPRDDVYAENVNERHGIPSAPEFDRAPDYNNDIEEQMIQAAIEASKREAEVAEHEKILRELRGNVGASEVGASVTDDVELGTISASIDRVRAGNISVQDEAEDVEEQPLVRHRSRRTSSGSLESAGEVAVIEDSPPSSPVQNNISARPQHNGNAFPEEWGGISSEEHDEAVMLEAAMFGGIPERPGYQFPHVPHQFMPAEGPYSQGMPRPVSPSLQAQRMIREQQDDEYLASLAADREKELKAVEEAEARRLEEAAARKAALEQERRKEEQQQEFERQLAAKEASLPQEPSPEDENSVTLLVRMPNGTRRGRRFLKSDNLRSLFDFIDIARVVKPGSYRLVRPYPRRAFSEGDGELTLNELGLTSKQEALFLESI